ncbi:MAG: hypothetical protein AAFR04_08080 [Pseudomonadota bacterium]
MALFTKRTQEVACTVRVINTFDSLEAHVELDGDVKIQPGDAVEVEGAPIIVPYGESREIRRNAVVTRAGPIERAWTRLTGDLEFMELCEFSFSEERHL